MEKTYTAPTLDELKKTFGQEMVGNPISVEPKKCMDAQDYIKKLNKAYRATKKSTIQFD